MKPLTLALSLLLFSFSHGQQFGDVTHSMSEAGFGALRQSLPENALIGVGEATHGSKEFVATKGQFFLFLNRSFGYRNLAMEIPFSIGPTITAYINGELRRGYIDSILRPAKTVYSPEFFQFLDSLKAINAAALPGTGIRVWGFDADQYYDYALLQLKTIAEKLGPSYGNEFSRLSAPLPGNYKTVNSFKQQYTTPEALQAIKSISSFVDTISNRLQGDEKFFAIQCARQLEISFSYFSGDKKFFTSRDVSMAAIVQDLCRHIQSTKMMLWGHNMHIKQATRGNKNMGLLLKNVFDETYYTIGSVFSEGSYRVWFKGVLSQKSLPASTSGEMTTFLSKMDQPAFWFKASDLLPYFTRQKVEEHEVGIVQLVDRPAANKTVLLPFKDFDVYFYFKKIEALDIPAGN